MLDVVLALVPALEDLGQRTAAEVEDTVFAGVTEPYDVNVGMLRVGDWRSSVASAATLGVRFGHLCDWSADEAIARIDAVVAGCCEGTGVSWSLRPAGYRVKGHSLDPSRPLVDLVASAHEAIHGSRPEPYVIGSTTDARYYPNTAATAALCYGPVARQIHGVDEAVKLSSIVDGARTLGELLTRVAEDRRAIAGVPRAGPSMPEADDGSRLGFLGPVSVPPAAEKVVTSIALGQFQISERLPAERELAAMLDVSRTTLREAVSRLVESGYVRVQRGRAGGTFVETAPGREADVMIRRTLTPNWDRIEQLLDFRAVIEAEIARVAARRRTACDIEAIRAASHAYAGAGEDRLSSSSADRRLHQAIATSTGNSFLVELSARTRSDVGLGIGADPWSPKLRRRGLHQHPELAHAVIEGDVARAGALAAEHFSLTERTLRHLLASVRGQGRAEQAEPTPLRGTRADTRP